MNNYSSCNNNNYTTGNSAPPH